MQLIEMKFLSRIKAFFDTDGHGSDKLMNLHTQKQYTIQTNIRLYERLA
jgi:hypothetical protein